MRRLLQFCWVQHRVITRGKLIGGMNIEGRRSDSFWF